MGDLDNGWTVSDDFPEHPLTPDALTAALDAARAETTPWDDPRQTRLGFAMAAPDPLAVSAWASFLPANTNNVGVHTGYGAGKEGTRRLEREALLRLADLYRADSAEGYLTSGATEAVIQGLRIGRNAVRLSPRDRVTVITGEFAHHSVAKAAEILGLDHVAVPADGGWTLTLDAVDRAIGTAVADGATGILLAATAGYYNSGLCDPIDALSELLRRRAVRDAGRVRYFCYVDAAHGGFVFPFSAPDLPFDFRNPGVHAMAVDPHKSGLLPYSCGVLLTRKGLLGHATAISPVTGVVDDTLIGSRSGAAAAALWAVLFSRGRSGFTALTRTCLDRRDALADAVRAADEQSLLRVAPYAPVVSVAFDIPDGRLPRDFEERYRLVGVNAPTAQGPRRLHYHFYTGHSLTTQQLDVFRRDLARAVKAARATAEAQARAAWPPGAPESPASNEKRASVSAQEATPATACFRHFVVHPRGRRDPDGPGYSFHTFLARRSTGEQLQTRRWGPDASGREVTVFAPDLDEPFGNELLGVSTTDYSLEILDTPQQKLSLVGATHLTIPLPALGCHVLVNFESHGAFRSVEYKFGDGAASEDIQCFADSTVIKVGKYAAGVRRPNSHNYSFSVDTSLECSIAWLAEERPAHAARVSLHSDPVLGRSRHLHREQYMRFPNRFFDTEVTVQASAARREHWRLSELAPSAAVSRPVRPGQPEEKGIPARGAGPDLCLADVHRHHNTLRVVLSPLADTEPFIAELPCDLGARIAERVPSLDVSRPGQLTVDAAVTFAEEAFSAVSDHLPVRTGTSEWRIGHRTADPVGGTL